MNRTWRNDTTKTVTLLNHWFRVQFKITPSDIGIISMAGEIKHNILGKKTGRFGLKSLSPNCGQKTSVVETSPQTLNSAATFSYSPFSNSQRMNAYDSQELGLRHAAEGRVCIKTAPVRSRKRPLWKPNLSTPPGASDSEPPSAQLHAQTTAATPRTCPTSTIQPTWSSAASSWTEGNLCNHKATSNEEIIFIPGL